MDAGNLCEESNTTRDGGCLVACECDAATCGHDEVHLTSLDVHRLDPAVPELLSGLTPQFDPRISAYRVDASYWLTRVEIEFEASTTTNVVIGEEDFGHGGRLKISLSPGENRVSMGVRRDGVGVDYELLIVRHPVQRLTPADANGLRFGKSLAAGEGLLMVGAPEAGSRNGSVYTFVRAAPGIWVQSGEHLAPRSRTFGVSLSYDGGRLAVGAEEEPVEGNDFAGALHLFRRFSVANYGRTVFVGAPAEPPQGAVYIYE